MYSKILVGINGTERGRDALALGSLLARATGASLTVGGVLLVDPRLSGFEPKHHDTDADYVSALEQAAEEAHADVLTLPSVSPARGLHELAEATDADLVIVGSSERGKVGQILAGSIALALLHGAPCSVAIAPVGFADKAPDAISQVTVGFDASDEAKLALAEAIDLARSLGASLKLVSVAQPPPKVYGKGASGTMVPHEMMEAIKEMARGHLDEGSAMVPDDVTVAPVLAEGEPDDALAEIAAEDGSILVLGSRAYGPLRRVLLGSVSTALVRSAPCPVIVHPRPAKATAAPTPSTIKAATAS